MRDLDDKCFNTKNLTLDGRSHGFNVGIAIDYSPNIALWLSHLAFWAEKNLANNKHVHDGLVWCYDTLEALRDYFPYFTRRQLETVINNSIKEGLVVKGNYNQTAYDRTVWYALTPKAYFYFSHLLTKKYIERLFLSISQNCEMDFTEFVNRFHTFVTPIPDTDPDTDPDKSVGDTPSQHTVKKFPTQKERNAKAAFESKELRAFFETKFKNMIIKYEDLFQDCQEHYESKRQWVTTKKWKSWIERENLDNYSKIGQASKKAPPNETDEQRKERQFFEYELMKERDNAGYVSEALERYPEMRQKYQAR